MIKSLKKEITHITDQIKNNYQPEKIILFGSFAYGRPNSASDIDMVVIKNTKERFLDRLNKISSFINSNMGTDILVYTPREWNELEQQEDYFIEEIKKTGKVLYEKK